MPSHRSLVLDWRASRSIARRFDFVGRVGLVGLIAMGTLGSLTFGGTARADVPPPRDYVETCTVARQENATRTCVACSSYHANPANHCATEVGAGFTNVCRTRGASTWTEVWCRPRDGAAAADPSPAPAPTEEPAAAEAPAPAPASNTAADAQADADDCTTAPIGSASLASTLALVGWIVARRRARRGGA